MKMRMKGVYRAIRYGSVGTSTFLFDLGIVFFLINVFDVHYLHAVAIGFVVGITLHYAISRLWVFKGTERTIHHGYLYFVTAGIVSLTTVLLLVSILVGGLGMPLIIARPMISAVVGSANYLFNLYLNFKVAGKHV